MTRANGVLRRLFGCLGLAASGEAVPAPGPAEVRGIAAPAGRETVSRDRERSAFLSDLDELEVSDVMVHRTAMRGINADEAPDAIVRAVLDSPYSRMPLWRGSTDNIIGVIHQAAMLRALVEAGSVVSAIDLAKVADKPWFVPDTTGLKEQLSAFLRRGRHFAIVVDEYGEVQGLVTIGDILEEIAGEASNEREFGLQGVRQEPDGSIVVDGSVSIRDLNRALDWSLPDEEATTIAGLVIHESKLIPEERQAFTFHGKRFIVMKRVKNRITRLRIRPVERTASTG